ncbi:MAG: 4-hydroxy-3-methylbut-2-enyl diphosphate reductase [Ferruginibacter sp.]
MKQFTIPFTYRSALISSIKNKRREQDKMKKDFSPTQINLGNVEIYLARHFGFCYGVENAIEIAFKTIEENQGKRIFLLSEMIHNPSVNADLKSKGVKFLQDTKGNQLISYDELHSNDIVLIPAFGTTLDIEAKLKGIGIAIEYYNTTCPFVEKVWNRSAQIAENNFTVVIHGKPWHEETRATFSHAAANAPTVVVNDMADAILFASYIKEEKTAAEFYSDFEGRYSTGFDVAKDLQRIGVVNQTTMLASDTQAIADYLKTVMMSRKSNIVSEDRFADTKDTLCYATNDNQSAVYGLLQTAADFAIVVGGYNSSNTSHLVELCEAKLPTYFINDETKIISKMEILHYDLHQKEEIISTDFIPKKAPVKILITSGASCPDAIVERLIKRIADIFNAEKRIEELLMEF